jgi:hypothetical protein
MEFIPIKEVRTKLSDNREKIKTVNAKTAG